MYTTEETRPIAERIASSRINMLLVIYEAAIKATERAAAEIRDDNKADAAMARSQALVLVGLIESGLDLSYGKIPQNIKDLCRFIEESLLTSDPERIDIAARVLRNLHEGFRGINDQAQALEAQGLIPNVTTTSVDTVV